MLGLFNREGYWVSPSVRECTTCGAFQEQVECLPCRNKRVKNTKAEIRMLRRARNRAKDKGLDFNIELEDITIPYNCPVFGFPLQTHKSVGGQHDSPSLDRINNDLGYVKGNVQVISMLANRMKGSASDEMLEKFAHWILTK